MAPVNFVRLLGGNYSINAKGILIITTAAGKSFAQSFVNTQDRVMVPLLTTSKQMGALADWSPSTLTVTLKAKLEMARVLGDTLLIATSYPVYYKAQSLDSPSRLLVDVYGADLDSPPATIPANSSLVTHIRTGQLDPETVRLVLDIARPIHFQVASSLQTSTIQLALGTKQTDTAPISSLAVQPPPRALSVQTVTVPAVVAPTPSGLVPLPPIAKEERNGANVTATKIVNVEYKTDAPNVYEIVVTTAGPTDSADQAYHAFYLQHPNRLAFDVNNSVLSITDNSVSALASIAVPDNNPLLHAVRWGMVQGSGVPQGRIVVDLIRPVVYTVSTTNLPDNSGVQYTISIQQSMAGSGPSNSIAGKIVIIDAGHGGKDSGAPGAGNIYEKNFTLAIAKQLRDALIAAGAQPILTRSDDTFIPLEQRSQMGIDAHADYFISIHCDSSDAQNSRSGDTVYYHGNVSSCRSLAHSIAERLAQLDIGIQSNGIKSDFVRFPGVGFSVLRKSPEPAVLVECGYVNDDNDAKCLESPADQQQIATGIVAGLRDFVANQ
jgi:N-acetylmuramoyl-L-alanine amidase